MPAISIKIDFKFDEKGFLRIIDVGDGLSAGLGGFPENTGTMLLKDWYEASRGDAFASLLGELPKELMQPETVHFPLVRRQLPIEDCLSHIDDLAQLPQRLLPVSGAHRQIAYQAYLWRNEGARNTATLPLSLIGTEMHKILWYVLMDMHLPPEARQTMLYWCNDVPPTAFDFSTIGMSTNGVFIKIGDRSTGGASDVYYAKNETAARKILQKLHCIYTKTSEKHVFIIEPAHITMKGAHNVTGRAFITLHLDEETHALSVKIADAKWIAPEAVFSHSKSQAEMLANVGHSQEMFSLDTTELEKLSCDLVSVYGDVFRAAFAHDNVIEHGETHPAMPLFLSCLRSDASYLMCLNSTTMSTERREVLSASLLITHMQRDRVSSLEQLLLIDYKSTRKDFLESSEVKKLQPQYMQTLINCICHLSLFDRYIAFLKAYSGGAIATTEFAASVISKARRIELKIDGWLKNYLENKSASYDTKDFSRALRQASLTCDLAVIKLLIHTNRADVNACSPKTQQTPLDFLNQSTADTKLKAHALNILRSAGAKTAAELALEEETQLLSAPGSTTCSRR